MGHQEDHLHLNFIRFRNSHHVGPVIIQCFMLLSAFLVIVGLTYVAVLAIAISIHHYLFDKDPKRVPSYVKKSLQFDTDSEDSDSDVDRRKKSAIRPSLACIEICDEDEFDRKGDRKKRSKTEFSAAARKVANLDKFMRQEIDVNKKN